MRRRPHEGTRHEGTRPVGTTGVEDQSAGLGSLSGFVAASARAEVRRCAPLDGVVGDTQTAIIGHEVGDSAAGFSRRARRGPARARGR
jgi:hypothetical protein